jgi:thiamine biosynthesis protein ThiI
MALGTYEISIVPDQDCCTLFVPRNPMVRAESQEIAQIEAKLDMTALIQQGIEGVQVFDFVQEQGRVRVSSGTLSTVPATE